jgi:hypothetical protein
MTERKQRTDQIQPPAHTRYVDEQAKRDARKENLTPTQRVARWGVAVLGVAGIGAVLIPVYKDTYSDKPKIEIPSRDTEMVHVFAHSGDSAISLARQLRSKDGGHRLEEATDLFIREAKLVNPSGTIERGEDFYAPADIFELRTDEDQNSGQ